MKKLLCPSMMCADSGNLAQEVRQLEEAGADLLHLDIMDGSFVPNFAMGLSEMQWIAQNTALPVDAHLMIENPGRYIELFRGMGVQILYIHPESDVHSTRTLDCIQKAGIKPGIALNPGTSCSTVRPLLSLVDYVLVMTVNPGFAGQQYLPFVDEKVEELLLEKQRYSFRLILDGACSPDVISRMSTKGVDGFVLGTSALFGKNRPYRDIIQTLRRP